MALKGLDAEGSGWASDLSEAIGYAVDNGARVINASWGGPPSLTVANAVAYAQTRDVVFVAAAGNSSLDLGAYGVSPANHEGSVTVRSRVQRAPRFRAGL